MKARKLPLWVLAIVLALCAALAGVVIWQGSRLRSLQQSAPDQTGSASSAQQGTSAPDAVESSVRLTKSFELTPTGVDKAGGTASADVSLELWDDRPGAAVTLLVMQGGASSSLPLTRSDSGVYTTLLTLPLPAQQSGGNQSVSLTVTVEADGAFMKERLGDYPNTRFMTSSLRADLKEGGMTYVRKSLPAPGVGLMRMNADCRLSVLEGGEPVAVGNPSFRLYRNGKLMKQLSAVEDETGRYLYGPQEWDNALVCRNGDEVTLTFACTGDDERSYEFQLESASVTKYSGDVMLELMPPAVS
ncbi:MAG: anti-sigma factor [Oscillibacter sp.]|nr:anti-sigma factor [Oscillibacter sp.]